MQEKYKIGVKKQGNVILIEIPVNTRFLLKSWLLNILFLIRFSYRKKIDIVHTFCTPAGSVGAILKFFRKKIVLILDSVEPHAESMVECNIWKPTGLKFKFLFFMEKIQIKRASYLVMANYGMDKYIWDKFKINIQNFFVKPACVNLNMFSLSDVKDTNLVKQFKLENKIVAVYAGKFGGFYFEDEIFSFIKQCQQYWGENRFRCFILSSVPGYFIDTMIHKYSIDKDLIIKLFVPYGKVSKYIGLADFALSPIKSLPSKKYCSPIKNGEYWALGLPVVITPGISNDSGIIRENNIGAVLENLDDRGYKDAIKQIDSIISNSSRQQIYDRIRPIAEKYRNYNIARQVYSNIYSTP